MTKALTHSPDPILPYCRSQSRDTHTHAQKKWRSRRRRKSSASKLHAFTPFLPSLLFFFVTISYRLCHRKPWRRPMVVKVGQLHYFAYGFGAGLGAEFMNIPQNPRPRPVSPSPGQSFQSGVVVANPNHIRCGLNEVIPPFFLFFGGPARG